MPVAAAEYFGHETAICCNPQNSSNGDFSITKQLQTFRQNAVSKNASYIFVKV